MLLTDSKIKNSKPTEKAFKLPDGKGLFLLVHPNGSKYWRLRYSFGRKEKLLSLGLYPDISLAEARNKQYEARRQIANGIDPSVLKKASKQAAKTMAENSFEAVAREWYAKYSPRWALSHSQKTIRRLERDIFPWLGSRPIAEITPPEVLATLRRTESRTLDTAHRARHSCIDAFGRGRRSLSTDNCSEAAVGGPGAGMVRHFGRNAPPAGRADFFRWQAGRQSFPCARQ